MEEKKATFEQGLERVCICGGKLTTIAIQHPLHLLKSLCDLFIRLITAVQNSEGGDTKEKLKNAPYGAVRYQAQWTLVWEGCLSAL